ncbi:hypothetical protein [Yersinia mollaretii]|uniref:hypothetical protein n=1 Tax=Yersinia mollaretii TaxID=33060 RepID=UPI0005DC6805|nr:hypothetical protein [Yersinia mollaretii]PJE87172.1 hypothetical protein CU280_13780 [Yersinia mollaretii]CQD38391.1 alpha-related fimbriae chaperone 2 [Yersinia mollaretii]CQH40844.1 alpha-related fimbriae chaperone 2 [Yersinia mollaretii]
MNLLLFIAASLLPFSAFAAIDIQPHVLEMQQANAVVNVINHSSATEYVTVQLYQINNPGVSPEQESLTFVGEQSRPSLFAAPTKLTLGPKQSGRILLKALQSPEKEQIYRLSVVPEKNLLISGGHGAVLGVQLSYMGLIRHLPTSPQQQWEHHCIRGVLELQNTGNTRLQWHQLKTTDQDIDDFNLYPGQRRQLATKEIQGMIEDKTFSLRCSVD